MGGSLYNSPLGVVEWVSDVISFKTGVAHIGNIDIRLHLVLSSGIFLTITLLSVRVVIHSFIHATFWNLSFVDECSYLSNKEAAI